MNSRFFGNDICLVPSTAVTVGVKTVLNADEVVLLVSGYQKARALQAAVEGPVNHGWTCSALQLPPKAMIVCDEAAVVELKVGTYRYFKEIEAKNLGVE